VIDATQLPVPRPSQENEPFWNAAREQRLVMPKCGSCGKYSFPASNACQHCGAETLAWVPVSGRGTVFSFVVYHRVYDQAFKDRVPYVVAVIALEEGPRLLTNIVGCEIDQVRCDMPVHVVFDDVREGGMVIPQFTPAAT
jgi:uncharacterized OB-fold protein